MSTSKHDYCSAVSSTEGVSPEHAVIVQECRCAAILLQHNRVAFPSGQKGDSQAPLPSGIFAAEGEGEV